MNSLTCVRVIFYRDDNFFRKILRVIRHKSQTEFAVDFSDFVKKHCEIYFIAKIFSVRVYVLSEQGYFLITVGKKAFYFRNYVFRLSAAFPASDVRNDAIRTKIVATVHNVNPRVGKTRTKRFDSFDYFAVFFEYFHEAFFRIDFLLQKFAEFIYVIRSDNHIYVRIRLQKFFGKIALLRHAAANRDDKLRIFAFEFFVHSDIAESVLFGVFSHATGVENNNVRVLGLFTLGVPHSAENPRNLFGFVNVHLTPVRMYNIVLTHNKVLYSKYLFFSSILNVRLYIILP